MQLYFHFMPVQGCLDSTCFSRCLVMRVRVGRNCVSLCLLSISVRSKGICQSPVKYVLYCAWCQRSHEGPQVGEHSCCCPPDLLLTGSFHLAVLLWTHSSQPSSDKSSPNTIFNSLLNLLQKKSVCCALTRLKSVFMDVVFPSRALFHPLPHS